MRRISTTMRRMTDSHAAHAWVDRRHSSGEVRRFGTEESIVWAPPRQDQGRYAPALLLRLVTQGDEAASLCRRAGQGADDYLVQRVAGPEE
jgi:hypothetical protein